MRNTWHFCLPITLALLLVVPQATPQASIDAVIDAGKIDFDLNCSGSNLENYFNYKSDYEGLSCEVTAAAWVKSCFKDKADTISTLGDCDLKTKIKFCGHESEFEKRICYRIMKYAWSYNLEYQTDLTVQRIKDGTGENVDDQLRIFLETDRIYFDFIQAECLWHIAHTVWFDVLHHSYHKCEMEMEAARAIKLANNLDRIH